MPSEFLKRYAASLLKPRISLNEIRLFTQPVSVE